MSVPFCWIKYAATEQQAEANNLSHTIEFQEDTIGLAIIALIIQIHSKQV